MRTPQRERKELRCSMVFVAFVPSICAVVQRGMREEEQRRKREDIVPRKCQRDTQQSEQSEAKEGSKASKGTDGVDIGRWKERRGGGGG